MQFKLYILQIFLFAAQAVLGSDHKESAGYLLLKCLRSYLNVRMYADLDLHTERTIAAGQKELQEVFTPAIQVPVYLN